MALCVCYFKNYNYNLHNILQIQNIPGLETGESVATCRKLIAMVLFWFLRSSLFISDMLQIYLFNYVDLTIIVINFSLKRRSVSCVVFILYIEVSDFVG